MLSFRRARGTPSCRSAVLAPLLLLAGAAGAPTLTAQVPPPPAPQPSPPAPQSAEELQRQLAEERAARIALEKRLAALEAREAARNDSDMESQLRGLVSPGDLQTAPARTVFPGAANPKIGVFADATLQGGNFDSKLGDDSSDRFSLRETEIDMRLPISPFAEGVLIVPFEDEGDGAFDGSIEEGYANVGLSGLLDNDWTATMKLGRFRPIFGRNNQLHTHDWLQVNQPLPVQNLLGDEGIVGDGAMFQIPLSHSGEAQGEGRTTSLDLSLVNGEILAGEGALGTLAENAGLSLDSDGPMAVARLSHFVELGALSDVEFGVSHLRRLDNDALLTDAGTRVKPTYYDADITWRTRDDETGVGSWLVQAEAIHTDVNYEDSGDPDFPVGSQTRDGWWLTLQRQISPTVYLGLLYARSDELGTQDKDSSVSPYVSWYADEFFRIRWQVDRQNRDVASGADVNGAWRAIMQFTWNFGVHQPHPYWVNK
ncbi:MAG TPA: hypothetical protein VK824_00940 [Planctomycetota bacterium]|nr:hypothetical protein [Planctomycetota bacterium]